MREFLFQPHNYRLYFSFNRANFKPPLGVGIYKNHSFGLFRVWSKNYGSEVIFKGAAFTIVIKKNLAEVINKMYADQYKSLLIEKPQDADQKIDLIFSEMDAQAVQVLKDLIRRFGGVTDFKIVKAFRERGLKDERLRDRIDPKQVIHDTDFKKVYKSQKLEFFSDVGLKNFVKNRALEDFSPVIAKLLQNLALKLDETDQARVNHLVVDELRKMNPLRALKSQVNCIDDVMQFSDLVRLLTESEKRDFELWLFEKFAIKY